MKVGTRVKVSARYPGTVGRTATVVRVPEWGSKKQWIEIEFDDNPGHVSIWQRSYFDVIPNEQSATED